MTVEVDSSALARLVAAEADPARRNELLRCHADLINARFFEDLREAAPQDLLDEMVHEAMSIAEPGRVDQMRLIAQLIEADQQGRLDAAITAHEAKIAPDFVDIVLQTIEDATGRHAMIGIARLLARISFRLIRLPGLEKLEPELLLRVGSQELLAGNDDAASHAVSYPSYTRHLGHPGNHGSGVQQADGYADAWRSSHRD